MRSFRTACCQLNPLRCFGAFSGSSVGDVALWFVQQNVTGFSAVSFCQRIARHRPVLLSKCHFLSKLDSLLTVINLIFMNSPLPVNKTPLFEINLLSRAVLSFDCPPAGHSFWWAAAYGISKRDWIKDLRSRVSPPSLLSLFCARFSKRFTPEKFIATFGQWFVAGNCASVTNDFCH